MKQLQVFNYIESWFTTEVDYFLQGLEEGEEFEVVISSPGGDAMAGISAYHMLKSYKPVVKILAHASSSASVLAMCGSKIIAEEGSLMLLHPASGGRIGTAKDLERASKNLQKVTDSAKTIYMTRFKGTEEELDEILERDEFHDAEQLKEWGFVDEIIPAEKIADETVATASMVWMFNEAGRTKQEDDYIKAYLSKYEEVKPNKRPKENTTNINNQLEDSNMDIQAKYTEQVEMTAKLSANLKQKEQEIEQFSATMTALKEQVATMTSEKEKIEKQLTERTTKFDEMQTKLQEIESANMKAEIDNFLNDNSKKIAPAQKTAFKMMLESAKMQSDEAYTTAKKSIEEMPELSILTSNDTTGRADNDEVVLSAEEALKMNWNEMDISDPENDALLATAIEVVMKANPALSELEAENKLMEVK